MEEEENRIINNWLKSSENYSGKNLKFPPSQVRFAARILWKRKRDAEFAHEFSQLISHKDDFSSKQMERMAKDAVVLKEYLNNLSLFSGPADLIEIFCKITCNSFSICDDGQNGVAVGLYPQLSFLNHSCAPNCVMIFEKDKAFLRTITDIAADQELTVSYIDILKSRSKRREELKERYFFDCCCSKCASFQVLSNNPLEQEILERLRCPQKCAGSVKFNQDSNLEYNQCGFRLRFAFSQIQEMLIQAETDYKEGTALFQKEAFRDSILKFEKAFEIQRDLLKPDDAELVDTVTQLYEGYLKLEDWTKAISFGQLLVQTYEALDIIHPLLGIKQKPEYEM